MSAKPTDGKNVRAVGYSRTSGEGQRDNTSIPIQKEAIEATCRANGWTLVRHYVDECRSGSSIAGREEFQQMLRDAARGEFDVIAPFDAKRFARDGVDVVSTAKSLKQLYGVVVVDSKGQFDNRDHRNALRNFVEAGVSEHERLTIMERMLGGRIERARNGLPWAGNPPIGREFRKTCGCVRKCKCHKGEWVVNDQGRKLAELLTRYVKHEPLSKLYAEYGYHSEAHVQNHVRQGQLAAGGPDNPYVVTFHTPEIGINNLRVEVPAIPQVITADLEREVKSRLSHNRKWNKQHLQRYVLCGFIYCAHCGYGLCGAGNYYRHSTHHSRIGKGRCGCGWTTVRRDRVEGPVMDYLYRWFVDQPAFDLAISMALGSGDDRKDRQGEAQATQSDLREVEREIRRLVDAVAAGADPELLVGKQMDLKARRDALRERLNRVEGELAALPDPDAIREDADVLRGILAHEHTGKNWRSESYDDIQRFLHFLFGDDPKKEGLGIFIRRWGGEGGRGRGKDRGMQLEATIRARLRLRSPWYQVGEDDVARLVGMPDGDLVEDSFSHDVDLMPATT